MILAAHYKMTRTSHVTVCFCSMRVLHSISLCTLILERSLYVYLLLTLSYRNRMVIVQYPSGIYKKNLGNGHLLVNRQRHLQRVHN